MEKKRSVKISTSIMYHVIRVITVLLLGYGIVGMLLNRSDGSQIGDYLFISINALGLFLLSYVPGFIRRKWSIRMPDASLRIYLIFVTCALLLGEIGRFFENVSWWDSALHLISGSLIGIVGFSLVKILNSSYSESFKLSPAFIALFVFCFSLAVGVLWEIIEFSIDAFFGSNMQRFRDNFGVGFIGRAALADTMKDFILNTLGAMFISVLGYIDLKRDLGLIEKMALKKVNNDNFVKKIKKV